MVRGVGVEGPEEGVGVNCQKCGGPTIVTYYDQGRKRSRRCLDCTTVEWTVEVWEPRWRFLTWRERLWRIMCKVEEEG